MIYKEHIEARLIKLKKYIKILKGYQKYSFEKFYEDLTLRGAVERYFQLSTECVIDIGEIIIADLELSKPEDARDVIDILGQENIIPDKFAYHFGPITGFRNALVHDYLDIDYKTVYKYLQNEFRRF